MADDDIDWSLLKTPDAVGDYVNAFRVGRRIATEGRDRPGDGPLAPPAAAGVMDGQLPRTLPASGPDPMADPAAASRRLMLADAVARAIAMRTADPVLRADIAQHIARANPGLGIDPERLTPEMMTDAQIAALHAAAAASSTAGGGSSAMSGAEAPGDYAIIGVD